MADGDSQEDAALLAGDAHSFGRFYERHEDFVLAVFMRRGAGAEVAADLTAETFARALAARRAFDPELGQPRAWLYGIARNVLSDSFACGRVEDRARRALSMQRLALDDQAIAAIEQLTGDLALAALDGLPEDQRLAVRGRVLEEAEYDELARALRCSPSVARKRVSRGLKTLRRRLEGAT
jgi:RNA polymerase sigma-70 factor (ECF subfamily)